MESEPVGLATIDAAAEGEYNLRARHPERSAVYEGFARRSEALRRAEPRHQAQRYAASPNCVVDFFPAAVSGPAPLLFFIHGGYWRALDRGLFSFLARPWLDRGVHVALPGYDLAPAVTVRAIADQVRAAFEMLLAQAGPLGIDRARCIVSGHSAGAHLGALLLCERRDVGAAAFVGISGVYDLRPLLATSVNHDIRLNPAEAAALSPALHDACPAPRCLCAVGGAETAGFRQQSQRYAAMLQERGCAARSLEVPGRTHFDVLDDLADPSAALFRAAFALLSPA